MLSIPNNKKDTTTAKPAEFVKLYPNPTSGSLILVVSANTSGIVKFEMIDALGQTVKNIALQSNINYTTFDVSNLANGIYHWRVFDNARAIGSGKETIVK